MTPKLEIHAADGDFIAATYTLDNGSSVTGRGFSACDAVANLRVFLQPFGYELPNVELSSTLSNAPNGKSVRNGSILGGSDGEGAVGTTGYTPLAAPDSPISECESAVDRVFKQHLSTGRN